jgi:hypothetical protein
MLVGIVLPAKHPNETFACAIQFTELDETEGIVSSQTTAVRLRDGVDVSGDLLTGADEPQGDLLLRRIQGGDFGERYQIHMQITTTGSNTYRHWFDVPMIPTAI